jgi:murein DD-endopeptidase MepM/ murein hydrolase activator NlpD
MIQISINLPAKRRLDFSIVKKRGTDAKPLLPNLGNIRRVRKGNKFSRFFRHIFEHKNIKKVFGINLFALVLVTSLIPQNTINAGDVNQETITQAPIVLTTERRIQYPLENVVVSQGYRLYHPGVDYDVLTGNPVYPFMNGFVEAISYSRYAYGNAVLVNHEEGLTSLYAHLSKIEVTHGQPLTLETKIGEVGATGYASGDHLHFEIRNQGYPINPKTVLP